MTERNADNFKKHGFWFEEAATIFSDPLAKTALDNHPGENRLITIGTSSESRLPFSRSLRKTR
jgi:uncharacterized DUF497 family protein